MTVVRAELAPKFYFGNDAVLLAMDTAGVTVVLGALTKAQQHGSSRLDHDGMVHQFIIEAGAADIELRDDRAVWRLDNAKAAEIGELLTHMAPRTEGAGHYYVDMSTPAKTLVLSRNEYV